MSYLRYILRSISFFSVLCQKAVSWKRLKKKRAIKKVAEGWQRRAKLGVNIVQIILRPSFSFLLLEAGKVVCISQVRMTCRKPLRARNLSHTLSALKTQATENAVAPRSDSRGVNVNSDSSISEDSKPGLFFGKAQLRAERETEREFAYAEKLW